MKLVIQASKEELEEIAKLAYLANIVVSNSNEKNKNYQYPDIAIFNSALRLLYKALLQHMPASGLIEIDENAGTLFTHTLLMEQQCSNMVNEYGEESFDNQLCTTITNRDYKEKGGDPAKAELFYNGLYETLYNNNMIELKANGLGRFRIVK